MIVCPFHKDSDPSLIINLDPKSKRPIGSFYCFGCTKHGKWNELADAFGLMKVNGRNDQVTEFHGRDIDKNLLEPDDIAQSFDAITDDLGLEFVVSWPTHMDWRSIPGQLLSKIGAQLALDSKTQDEVVFLPIVVNKCMVGGIKALMERPPTKDILAYVNSSGVWAREKGLFPLDHVRKQARKYRRIIIVEGARDALRLIACGLPAVAILGTHNWDEKKRDLLIAIGIESVVLMMDSDEAGRKAQRKIKRSCAGLLEVKSINMKAIEERMNKARIKKGKTPFKKIDPVDLPIAVVNRLRRLWFR
jgi:5S rRNA maturation endonuclease (ribonuclease M5)